MLSVEKFSYCFGREFCLTDVTKIPGEMNGFSWNWQEGRGGGERGGMNTLINIQMFSQGKILNRATYGLYRVLALRRAFGTALL